MSARGKPWFWTPRGSGCVQQRNKSKEALAESLCGISLVDLPPIGGESVPGSDAGAGCEECTEWTTKTEVSWESVPDGDPNDGIMEVNDKQVLNNTTGCSKHFWNPDGEDTNGDGFCD